MSRPESRSDALLVAATEVLHDLGFRSVTLIREARTTEGSCLTLKTNDDSAFMLKTFSGRFAQADRASHEFRALQLFSAKAHGHQAIRVPTPLHLLRDHDAYLMSWLPGRPLTQHLLSTHPLPADRAFIASSLLEAFSLYYEAVGTIYGDCQPANVLVSCNPSAVGLVDPTPPEQYFADAAATASHAPLSADLGYWTYSVLARTWRNLPKSQIRRASLCFTEELLLAASVRTSEPQDFLDDVLNVAQWHRQRLWSLGSKEAVISATMRRSERRLGDKLRREVHGAPH